MTDHTVLVVAHPRSLSVMRLAEACVAGTHADGIDGVTTRVVAPLEAGPDDVLAADGIVLAGPEHFGLLSGLVKDFLERIYYPCLDETVALPYGLIVHGRHDGTGTIRSTERIITGMRWKAVCAPVLSLGEVTGEDLAAAEELGATLAGGLSAGLW